MTTDKYAKQIAFSFYLGDTLCKIGAIFKGGVRTAPNMATTLCFLTTDVNISPEMLNKAFSSSVQNTLNLLNVDGVNSPNDFACILANGRAGNYKISVADTDYKKFANALNGVMANVCKQIASGANERYVVCKVQGARSLKIAREIAKGIAGAQAVRNAITQKRISAEDFVFVASGISEKIVFDRIKISVNGVVILEDGRTSKMPVSAVETLLQNTETEITISIGSGNYSATSVFCL